MLKCIRGKAHLLSEERESVKMPWYFKCSDMKYNFVEPNGISGLYVTITVRKMYLYWILIKTLIKELAGK